MSLQILAEMSNRYGANEEHVLAGGGNTSFKEAGKMYVKGSGTSLADIKPDDFVAMDVSALRNLAARQYPPDLSDDEREEAALADMLAARLAGSETKRPSVEAILHAIFPHKYVLHVHPALINGLTCGLLGEKCCREIFGETAAWVGLTKPGLVLSQACKKIFDGAEAATGKFPQIAILESHGIFVAADTVAEIDELYERVYAALSKRVHRKPDFSEVAFDRELACELAPAFRMLYSEDGQSAAVFCANKEVSRFVSDKKAFSALIKPFTPDHIVYCKDEPLFAEPDEDFSASFRAFRGRKNYPPKIAAVRGLGFFALGNSLKEAEIAKKLFLDAVKIAVYAESFGGINPLTDELTAFISNWEVEKYRIKASGTAAKGRLAGKIALVTGGAQGFGKGIAEHLDKEGALIAVADLNADGAADTARELSNAVGIRADVSDEESVKRMVQETVLAFGGLDILVSNAGVLVAGSLSEMTMEKFELVTKVNYTGYFLCAKYASEPMKIQRKYAPGYMTDIIEINSKSGLEGSTKNFAYAGSKFGGIGLTQSFAKELVEFGIKVNAICPGNLLDGPLWSDPERGLFRQYLDRNKVPGAKTVEDVRKHYENLVPMKRGCTVEDVARAIFYLTEQRYETGQALPVTGGQVMLN